ncbi:MAG: DUF1858 domain-containing protein [Deltaproteobacteria bacterium]|nr:MAG: DUF1858 domain-containing protein [Deltaproteobacteria bacterium]
MITKEMKIEEVIRKFPGTLSVFEKYGIDCAACSLNQYENIEQGARAHNIDLETLLRDLNRALVAREEE